ncbi:MAG: hypothetical protein KDE28_20275, partial [Anaerolineales bacterium]|nr:hypothetical protein [Anaerolineales bacterium]
MATIFRGLDAEAYDRQYNDRELAGRIFSYFRPHRRKIWIVVLAIFVMALMGAALPLIVSKGIEFVTEAEATLAFLPLVIIIFT